ncbi:MAG: exodeoxyribonuclease III [Gammaproteobacteria bacterium TMED78]|nr:MAG: exodeoxyribonuclease III [Gammaproteobacteria bacterium TMED78]|tara:strand:+ start:44333 stop:45100 length:768 start_codon:yes stop_codon:yes gene_type:complete
MKFASWNVNSLRVRLDQVKEWVIKNKPDVLGLQETKMIDDNFPINEFLDIGYKSIFNGQPTYNGVALLSLKKPLNISKDIAGFEDPQKRFISASYGNIRVINLYIPNGQSIDSDKYTYKLQWLKELTKLIKKESNNHKYTLLIGDFNIAPENIDVHDFKIWDGLVTCSNLEREALKKILNLGFKDTYRNLNKNTQSFSWWDYRAGSFRKNNGLRIDLLLASEDLMKKCINSTIDMEPRKLERPSDHAPVYAEFNI